MPQLDFATYPSQFLWLLIAFLLQYLLVSKIIVPAFKKLYQVRQNHIDSEIQKAEKLINHSELLRHQYETELKKAKESHVHLMQSTITSVKKEVDIKLKDLEHQLTLELKDQEKQLSELRIFAEKEIKNTALQSALLVINKLTDKKITASQINKYIN
jgi:F-type H+-transporting ATPase subunit b